MDVNRLKNHYLPPLSIHHESTGGVQRKLGPNSKWRGIRTRLRVLAHWKHLDSSKRYIPTADERAFSRMIKTFIGRKDVQLQIIENIVERRRYCT